MVALIKVLPLLILKAQQNYNKQGLHSSRSYSNCKKAQSLNGNKCNFINIIIHASKYYDRLENKQNKGTDCHPIYVSN